LKFSKEIPNFFYLKQRRFALKKKGEGTRRRVACLLFTFFLAKLPEWQISRRIFSLVWPPNPTTRSPTCPTETPLSRRVVRSGRKALKRLRLLAQSGHLGQSAALDCQIWQFEVHTLNQWLGFLESNQGMRLFPR
jgi:hypothetical protein